MKQTRMRIYTFFLLGVIFPVSCFSHENACQPQTSVTPAQTGSSGRYVIAADRSADGKSLIVGIADGGYSGVYSYSLPDGTLRWSKPFSNPPGVIALSPDGQAVAVAFGYREGNCPHVELLRSATGEALAKLEDRADLSSLKAESAQDVAFSHDGRLLAAALNNNVRVWVVATGKNYASIEPPGFETRKGIDTIQDLVFSPDDQSLAGTGTNHSIVYIWHLPDAKLIHQVAVSSEPGVLAGVIYNKDGTSIAVGSTGPTNVYHLENNRFSKVCRIPKPADPVLGPIMFDRDNNLWVRTLQDVQLWRCQKDKAAKIIRSEKAESRFIAAYKSNSSFITLEQSTQWTQNPGAESKLRLVDLVTKKEIATIILPGRPHN